MRLDRLVALLLLLAAVAASTTFATSCKRKGDAVAESTEMPVVSDKAEGLQLTWIDEKGEFHIEQRTTDVPEAARETVRVRVLDPAHDQPSGDRVFIADLRAANPDGSYPVRSVPRDEFEDVAVKRRAKSGTAVLTPQGPPTASAAASAGPKGSDLVDRPDVIIYGASWCGPCHQAAAYLKKRGVPFVEHDIEQDSSAAREMKSKLAKAGVRGGSIPVLDVKGRILVGFDARAVDQALGQAL